MKGKIIALGQIVISIGIMFIYGGLYPILSFPTPLEVDQIFSLRFLASFCFHGDLVLFWELAILWISLTLLISILLFIKAEKYLSSYFKTLIILHILFIFLFNVVAQPPKFKETPVRYVLPDNFLVMNGLLLLCIISLNLIFWLLQRFKSQKKSEPSTIEVSIYQCPHCGMKFFSNVQYCSYCKKQILSVKLP